MAPEPQSRQTTAVLYRMVMKDHVCPYGIKSKDLLERRGFAVEDHHLTTREQTDAFKREHGVETTPQTFIEGRRIGGYDELRAYFGQDVPEEGAVSYQPIVAIFSIAALMALAMNWQIHDAVPPRQTFESFVEISMCILAAQKLQDIEGFSTMFLNYDLLARRWVRYGYLYPFGEALAGVLMLAGVATWLAAPVAVFIGSVGAVSVIKAVYIDKRALKCACVGGNSKVPLGAVSLTENLMMVGMGAWMVLRPLI